MTKIDDGGPAFPGIVMASAGEWASAYPGMTLRDWLAGQAPHPPKWWIESMEGEEQGKAIANSRYIRRGLCEIDVQWRYKWADAMLAARKEQTNG